MSQNKVVSKPPKLTRAERRERRANVPVAGVYGVDVEDAGALTWTGRYMCWASSPQEARARIREAGFHKQSTVRTYAPSEPPREGLPDIPAGDGGWYRSRDDDGVWTPWERLPPDYRHPPQSLAAIDPTVR